MDIKINDLSKKYGRSFEALKGITLNIKRGMFGLLGPNGAGKTTLMQTLATLQPPTSGEVSIGDYVLGKDDQAIRQILGYLPQEFGLYKKLTGYEYLDYVALMKGIKNGRQRKEEVTDVLEKVNLTNQAKKKVGGYSGGMKQRIGIAQALLGSPELIIVDEPTAGLDPEERIRFRNLLSDLSAERIVILSTHIVADIESSCTQLAILNRGTIVFDGTQEELLKQVENKIWHGTVDDGQFTELRQQTKMISARKVIGGQEVRVLAQSEPFAGAELARVGLEDAYMGVMETAKNESLLQLATLDEGAASHENMD